MVVLFYGWRIGGIYLNFYYFVIVCICFFDYDSKCKRVEWSSNGYCYIVIYEFYLDW